MLQAVVLGAIALGSVTSSILALLASANRRVAIVSPVENSPGSKVIIADAISGAPITVDRLQVSSEELEELLSALSKLSDDRVQRVIQAAHYEEKQQLGTSSHDSIAEGE